MLALESNRFAAWILASTLTLMLTLPAVGGDWPELGGPRGDGVAVGTGLPEGGIELVTLWKRPLGSGYSGISVAGGSAVTMYCDETSDYLAAFDAASGEPRWTVRLGERYKGHDGSDDGPLSTPLIAEGRVFVVTADGRLQAHGLIDGKKIWSASLTETFKAVVPDYGFTTAPRLIDGQVIVQVGGTDGHGLCAFEPATGKLRWKLEGEAADYRTPQSITVGGERHLVMITRQKAFGIDAASGKVLWEHETAEDAPFGGISGIVPVGDGRFLVTGWNNARMFEVVERDGKTGLEELWTSTELRQSYGAPVYRNGVLYGYSGSYMTAVDAEAGERVWKSREPGKGVPIRMDDHLAVWAKGGKLHLAPANREGFAPVATADVLATGSLTAPSFADGTLYVRNLEEIAAVGLRSAGRGGLTVRHHVPELTRNSEFGRMLAGQGTTADPAAFIDRFVASQKTFPVVEDGSLVHFIYKGPGEDVGIFGSMTPQSSDSMHRFGNTDLFYRTYRLEPGARVEYELIVDFGEPQADPRNPLVAPGTEGKRSELRLPNWTVADYAVQPFDEPRGKTETVEIASEAMEETREVTVYLPSGYEAGKKKYPLLLVMDVQQTKERSSLPQIVDRLGGSAVIAYVPFGPGFAYWTEGYADKRDNMVRFVSEEILSELSKRYRLRDDRDERVLLGAGWGAFPALYAAVQRSEIFGKVAAFTLTTYPPMNDELDAILGSKDGTPRIAVYVGWGRYDHDVDYGEHIDLGRMNRDVAGLLRKHEHRVTTKEIVAGTGWGAWWSHVGPALETLLDE